MEVIIRGDSFMSKMCTLFSNSFLKRNNTEKIYGWYDKNSIIIKKIDLFLSTYVYNFFKLTKKESFYRQLHLYGFKKIRELSPLIIFRNENFKIDMNPNDLSKIKRIYSKSVSNKLEDYSISKIDVEKPLYEYNTRKKKRKHNCLHIETTNIVTKVDQKECSARLYQKESKKKKDNPKNDNYTETNVEFNSESNSENSFLSDDCVSTLTSCSSIKGYNSYENIMNSSNDFNYFDDSISKLSEDFDDICNESVNDSYIKDKICSFPFDNKLQVFDSLIDYDTFVSY